MEVTQWFGPDEKPVHVGEYETVNTYDKRIIYRTKWDGKWFLSASGGCPYGIQKRFWRGLANNPQSEVKG